MTWTPPPPFPASGPRTLAMAHTRLDNAARWVVRTIDRIRKLEREVDELRAAMVRHGWTVEDPA